MTRISCCFLWLALIALCGFAPAGWATPDVPPFGVYPGAAYSPTVTVLESDSVIRLDLLCEHLPHSGAVNFSNRLPGLWGEMNPTGSRLPRFTIYLAIPGTGAPVASVESWVDTVSHAVGIYLPDNAPPPPRIYLGHVGILGGVRVVPVTFRPIAYNNNSDSCSILSHAVIRIDMDSTAGENPVNTPRPDFSRPWQRLFQTVVTNWEFIPNIMVGANSHILMIVPDSTISSYNYLPAVHSFVRWKEQRGIKVTVVPKSSLGPTVSWQTLRNRIISELNTSTPRIDYVILVGDETRLPVSMVYTADPATVFSTETYPGSYTNELAFSAVTGDDVFPDVFLGRWVVNMVTEVQKVASRSVMHERDTFIVDSTRFAKGVVAADVETLSQWQAVARTGDMMRAHGFTTVDSITDHGHSYQMTQAIDSGRCFINYRGQGWNYGWWGIDFYVQDLGSLVNYRKLPIVTGIGCGVGQFYALFQNPPDNGGFGEAFMLGGTVDQPTGCAGFIGPCWNTHTVFNDCLDTLLYRGWFDYGNLELGPGLAAGKMMNWAMYNVFLNDNNIEEIAQTMMRQYIVESDPSLQVFTATPLRLQVSMPDSVIYGTPAELPISIANMSAAPAESLNVTVWYNDSTFDVHWLAPPAGTLDLRVNADTTDTVVVTITGDNVLAYQRTLRQASPEAARRNQAVLPQAVELAQNFPNPFNPETTIEFALPQPEQVRLEVYDVLGRRVATLVQGEMGAGQHRIVWKGTSESGGMSSGIYYYRLTTSKTTLARKMLLLR